MDELIGFDLNYDKFFDALMNSDQIYIKTVEDHIRSISSAFDEFILLKHFIHIYFHRIDSDKYSFRLTDVIEPSSVLIEAVVALMDYEDSSLPDNMLEDIVQGTKFKYVVKGKHIFAPFRMRDDVIRAVLSIDSIFKDVISLRTEEEVKNYAIHCLANNLSNVPQMIMHRNTEVLMKYGFYGDTLLEVDAIARRTLTSREFFFWRGRGESIHNKLVWTFMSVEDIIKDSIQTGNSSKILLANIKDQLYPSMRPITKMNQLRTNITSNKNRGGALISVTRYGKDIDGGCYFNTKGDCKWCGTFYYEEPASSTSLSFDKYLIFFNKTHAAVSLGIDINHNATSTKLLLAHADGKLRNNLLYTPKEFINIRLDGVNQFKQDLGANYKTLPDKLGYIACDSRQIFSSMYSAEDYLDQNICIKAREAGVEVIVFTHMVGSYQVVTEVLDVRSRIESIQSLVYD